MRPIDTGTLRRVDNEGNISPDPILRPGEVLFAATAEEVGTLGEELRISAQGIQAAIHQHNLLSNTNSQYGTHPRYLPGLEARQRNLELIRAGLPKLPQSEI